MNKLLLVEDDMNLRTALTESLEMEGFIVQTATNLEEARKVSLENIDLIILDWMLPDGQDIDFLKEVRPAVNIPVIMLTARTDLIDKVLGLESGANDYITKPFEFRELVARIRVQLRNHSPQGEKQSDSTESLKINELDINTGQRQVKYKNELIPLTKMEFDLLYLLANNVNQVFSREKLLDKVWGYDNYPTTRTVDIHVLQLRQKTSNDIIETVRGVGYRIAQNKE